MGVSRTSADERSNSVMPCRCSTFFNATDSVEAGFNVALIGSTPEMAFAGRGSDVAEFGQGHSFVK